MPFPIYRLVQLSEDRIQVASNSVSPSKPLPRVSVRARFKQRARLIWYRGIQVLCRLLAMFVLRLRCRGREHVPAKGATLLLSNHQSHLDPVLLGIACNRPLCFLARKTLFRFPPFAWLISSLNAFPIDREGSGFGGLKQTLQQLKKAQAVVIFPEGTRTPDGELQPLQAGFCAVARRSRAQLVPVIIEGSYAAWPRKQPFPKPARIRIHFGAPFSAADRSDDELQETLLDRWQQLQAEARHVRRREK